MIKITEIKEFTERRALQQQGVDLLMDSIRNNGFLDNNPVTVTKLDNGYRLIDGRHRLEAAQSLGIQEVPAIIKEGLTKIEEYQLASQCNNAAEVLIPNNMVTDAEFIWSMSKEFTQSDIAQMLGGWSRDKVARYAMLENINKETWKVIVTEFQKVVTQKENSAVTPIVTVGTITENLLRNILCLTPDQQHELVSDLITGNITKGKFSDLAKKYKARYDAAVYVHNILARYVDYEHQELLINAIKEIDAGKYDKEWLITTPTKPVKAKGNSQNQEQNDPQFISSITTQNPIKISLYEMTDKLIQSIKNSYDKINSIRLIHGDFYKEVKHIEAGTVDLVITDPPYNIAYDREFQYEGRKNISKDFGEWDKLDHEQFKETFDIWFQEFSRIMKPDSSGFIFTSDIYISHISEALQRQGFSHRSTITWHKPNPGTSTMKDNFISSNEYIVFFRRGKPTFNFSTENDMQNFISCPVCAGNERVKDPKGEVLHPTQKPQAVIRHLMEISSNIGDLVFDGFMGVGTTARTAKKLDRKFVGIEMEDKFFQAIRLED